MSQMIRRKNLHPPLENDRNRVGWCNYVRMYW